MPVADRPLDAWETRAVVLLNVGTQPYFTSEFDAVQLPNDRVRNPRH